VPVPPASMGRPKGIQRSAAGWGAGERTV